MVGQIACGKGELVKYLVEKYGFVSFSLSTIVHQELETRKIKKFDRKTLQDIGDDLRKKYGRDVLMKRAINQVQRSKFKDQINNSIGVEVLRASRQRAEFFQPVAGLSTGGRKNRDRIYRTYKRFVIEGIRNTAEVEYLKSLPNSTLIGVKARRELRFKRLLKRDKPWDPKTWEEFVIVDRRDLGIGQAQDGQQVGKCLHYCDFVLTNDDGVLEFRKKIKKIVDKIL